MCQCIDYESCEECTTRVDKNWLANLLSDEFDREFAKVMTGSPVYSSTSSNTEMPPLTVAKLEEMAKEIERRDAKPINKLASIDRIVASPSMMSEAHALRATLDPQQWTTFPIFYLGIQVEEDERLLDGTMMCYRGRTLVGLATRYLTEDDKTDYRMFIVDQDVL